MDFRAPNAVASDERRAAIGIALVIATLGVGICPWLGASWNILSLIALILVAAAVRKHSPLAGWHGLQLALVFGVAATLGGTDSPTAMKIVLVWAFGVAAGVFLTTSRKGPSTPLRAKLPLSPRTTHVVLGYLFVAAEAIIYRTHTAGFAAQLQTGVSAAPGWQGYVVAIAPAWVLILLVAALLSGKRLRSSIVLLVLQTGVSSLSGFRGAAPNFILSVVILATLSLPADSPWRHPKRIAACALAAVILATIGFAAGALVKNSAANNLGLASAGTRINSQSFGASIAKRIGLMEPLQAGIDARSNPTARDALSWDKDLVSIIPRFLYHDKPTLAYGQAVTTYVYGSPEKSSSTITFLGDIYLQFDVIGVALLAFAFGFACVRLGRRRDGLPSLPRSLLLVVVALTVTDVEGQPILTLVGALRQYLLVMALWWMAERMSTLAVRRSNVPRQCYLSQNRAAKRDEVPLLPHANARM